MLRLETKGLCNLEGVLACDFESPLRIFGLAANTPSKLQSPFVSNLSMQARRAQYEDANFRHHDPIPMQSVMPSDQTTPVISEFRQQ
jgi:hypothetical protein